MTIFAAPLMESDTPRGLQIGTRYAVAVALLLPIERRARVPGCCRTRVPGLDTRPRCPASYDPVADLAGQQVYPHRPKDPPNPVGCSRPARRPYRGHRRLGQGRQPRSTLTFSAPGTVTTAAAQLETQMRLTCSTTSRPNFEPNSIYIAGTALAVTPLSPQQSVRKAARCSRWSTPSPAYVFRDQTGCVRRR